MADFISTINPTSFGFFDSDQQFQVEANSMVNFVKRKLGDDVLSVELTKREIWTCFEEATLWFGDMINRYQLKSELASLLGMPNVYSASFVSGVLSSSFSVTGQYPRTTFEFLMRQAEPYAAYAGVGGAYETYMTYINLIAGQQDYNVYTSLFRGDGIGKGQPFFETVPTGSVTTKLRLIEVYHFTPLAAQQSLLNASNITNFLATEFNYESFVNSTVFYVLPVFEDILRRGMLETAFKVRRSNYSYTIQGSNLRIFPIPQAAPPNVTQLWIRVALGENPFDTGIANDVTINGVSNPSQVPFTNVQYSNINALGKQWIRQFTLTLCKELLGLIRRKVKTIPIPGMELQLDGETLVTDAREEKEKLLTDLKELLDSLTYDKLLELEAEKAEAMNTQLKYIPMPIGKAIIIG